MSFALLSDDLLLHVCELIDSPADAARCRAVCRALLRPCEAEPLWGKFCSDAGLTRNGSSRPTSRTYTSWRQTWIDARCAECGRTYVAKINLDGGSSQATMWHGAKVPLCGLCACAAMFCYRLASTTVTAQHMPRMIERFAPEGHMVTHICGRNVESMHKELGLQKDYLKWVAKNAPSTTRKPLPAQSSGS